jgi:hypothetical protein
MKLKVALMVHDNLIKAITKACFDALHEGMSKDELETVLDRMRDLVNEAEED